MALKQIRLVPGSFRERMIYLASAILCIIFAVLDQLTKFLVVKYIPMREHIRVIPGCFDLTYVTNDGAAWNMLSGKFYLLCAISLAAFVLLLVFFKKLADYWPERYFALFLILSGILGNSFDRFFRGGAVVDFLHCYIGKYAWPTFNVADSCICAGVFIFILSNLLRPENKGEGTKAETEEKNSK
ncbi:MAG: signal peptidase II [Lentisphaeria bacterium]|nr:signal peptidase II [Lentisphaeria bacterium]